MNELYAHCGDIARDRESERCERIFEGVLQDVSSWDMPRVLHELSDRFDVDYWSNEDKENKPSDNDIRLELIERMYDHEVNK